MRRETQICFDKPGDARATMKRLSLHLSDDRRTGTYRHGANRHNRLGVLEGATAHTTLMATPGLRLPAAVLVFERVNQAGGYDDGIIVQKRRVMGHGSLQEHEVLLKRYRSDDDRFNKLDLGIAAGAG